VGGVQLLESLLDPDVQQETPMPSIGIQELLIIFVILMVIFGGSKLPLLGRGMGEGIRNFKRGLRGDDSSELEEENASSSGAKTS
jgi:sec-independent protein translocase protein TatA